MKKTKKNFNIVIVGYGGQGVLTLAEIIAKAAFKEGYDVKQTEIHGLAQRGGTLQCHVRFGPSVYSPLVSAGCADLIISLEAAEALRACFYANKKTSILLNSKIFRYTLDIKQVLSKIKKYSKKLYVVDADKKTKKLTGNIDMVNSYLLAIAVKKGLLPLGKKVIWEALEERIHPIFLEKNKKIFDSLFGRQL